MNLALAESALHGASGGRRDVRAGPTAVALIGLLVTACGPSKPPPTDAEQYPGPWKESDSDGGAVARELLAHGVQGCGTFYMKDYADNNGVPGQGEYLVYCRNADHTWDAYKVWPLTHNVIGPDKTYAWTSRIPLPPNVDELGVPLKSDSSPKRHGHK
jgi:hypothetical protein